jgi:hypothetical protein
MQDINDTKPAPKTTTEFGTAVWNFYQSIESERFSDLLGDLLTAGKLELAIELLKLKELERLSTDVEEIRGTLESTSAVLADIANSVRYIPQ